MPGTGTVLTMPGLIGGILPLNTGTFHSVAYAQLRIYWQDRGIKEPSLLTNKISFVTNLLPRDKRSTDTLDVVGEIEWAKARRISPETYFAEAEKHERTPPLALQEISNIFKNYEFYNFFPKNLINKYVYFK